MLTKWLHRILISVGALLCPVLVLLVIHLPIFDERLLPEVKALTQMPELPPPQNNIYFTLLGLHAPEGADPNTLGQQIIENYQQTAGYPIVAIDFDTPEEPWREQYQFLICHQRENNDCERQIREGMRENPLTDARLILLLKRYSALIANQNIVYVSPVPVSVHNPALSYTLIMNLQRIQLANALTNESDDVFFQLALVDLHFWRDMLRQSNSFVDKMISTSAISNVLSNISQRIKNSATLDSFYINHISVELTNLSLEEYSFYGAFKGEAQFAASTQMSFNNDSLNFNSPSLLMHENATLNYLYRYNYAPSISLSQLTPKHFHDKVDPCLDAAGTAESKCLSPELAHGFGISSFYNILGKLMIDISSTPYSNYLARVYDLNGLINLIKLQAELKMPSDISINERISQSRFTNPYTDLPFELSNDKLSVSFKCLGDKPICHVKL